MLHVGMSKSDLFHPGDTIGAGVAETAIGIDQHVEAHEQPKRIVAPCVVDDRLVNNQGTIGGSAS